jgi:hypothetical protein
MAAQKIGKMKRHEMGESKAFERSEERMDKKHFVHEGIENISDHRKGYYTKGHAINNRESEV